MRIYNRMLAPYASAAAAAAAAAPAPVAVAAPPLLPSYPSAMGGAGSGAGQFPGVAPSDENLIAATIIAARSAAEAKGNAAESDEFSSDEGLLLRGMKAAFYMRINKITPDDIENAYARFDLEPRKATNKLINEHFRLLSKQVHSNLTGGGGEGMAELTRDKEIIINNEIILENTQPEREFVDIFKQSEILGGLYELREEIHTLGDKIKEGSPDAAELSLKYEGLIKQFNEWNEGNLTSLGGVGVNLFPQKSSFQKNLDEWYEMIMYIIGNMAELAKFLPFVLTVYIAKNAMNASIRYIPRRGKKDPIRIIHVKSAANIARVEAEAVPVEGGRRNPRYKRSRKIRKHAKRSAKSRKQRSY